MMMLSNKDYAITIIKYAPQYKEDFKRLNLEWIEHYFAVEDVDHLVLADPETYYLQPGGGIWFAKSCGDIVGTCGLLKHPGRGFELSKMGVTRLYRGIGIGKRLAETAIAHVKACGATGVFLETNSILIPATNLYRQLGFKQQPFPHGRSERYKRADMYMVLEL
jgi:GNAT superfamily N-acetyltransferase